MHSLTSRYLLQYAHAVIVMCRVHGKVRLAGKLLSGRKTTVLFKVLWSPSNGDTQAEGVGKPFSSRCSIGRQLA